MGDHAGRSVSRAGDVNGDGFADIIVGAPYANAGDSRNGTAYVVFGRAKEFGATIQLSNLDGKTGVPSERSQ
jgi:hypothetical protein